MKPPMREIVIDTETTGLDPADGHRVVEIGAVELIDRSLTGQTFHYYPTRGVYAGLATHEHRGLAGPKQKAGRRASRRSRQWAPAENLKRKHRVPSSQKASAAKTVSSSTINSTTECWARRSNSLLRSVRHHPSGSADAGSCSEAAEVCAPLSPRLFRPPRRIADRRRIWHRIVHRRIDRLGWCRWRVPLGLRWRVVHRRFTRHRIIHWLRRRLSWSWRSWRIWLKWRRRRVRMRRSRVAVHDRTSL
jgi:Exonuclease